jgi:hypothetical protein
MITPCTAPRGERSLYTRAVGYSYDAVKIFRTKD